MVYSAKVIDAAKQRTQCLIVGCYDNAALSPTAALIDAASGQQLSTLLKREKFSGKPGCALFVLNTQGINAERVLVLGLGKTDKTGAVEAGSLRKALSKALDTLKPTSVQEFIYTLTDTTIDGKDAAWHARLVSETLDTYLYRADGLKTERTAATFTPTKVMLAATKETLNEIKNGLTLGEAIAKGTNLARNLADLPGNICTPSYLADQAKKLARNQANISVKVLEEKDMKALGMGSLLSVSAGSDQPAKLIVLEYRAGRKNDAPVALVGKGITFDTGGISLKPGAGMDEMKYDMGGAASVLGAFQTLLELKPKINVVGVIAASENMPSGTATKPGDIVTSMSGLTIEVLNTDAEGRLVLCDALTYTERFKPKAIIDIATLTGACVIALGSHATGLFSNNDALAQDILAAGEQAHDRAWHMPLWDDYQKQLDSNFADIANIGGREAGSVTAACFLSRFVKDIPWAHLDVAGTAWKSGAAKGATGRPVPLLIQYLLNHGA